MSTLKTNNIEHVDASTPSVQMSIGGGVVFPGISTFTGNAQFDGNVNIAGTITYDDVTNIDSVGLITARIGVSYGAPGAATVIDGNATGIGIGTDNPSDELSVVSSLTTDSVLRLQGGNSAGKGSGIRLMKGASAVGYIGPESWLFGSSNTSDTLVISQNAQANLSITSAGKIGIGLTNPDRVLHLAQANSTAYSGTDAFDKDYHVLKLNNTTDDGTVGMQFLIGSDGEAAITASEVAGSATDLIFSTRSGGNKTEKLRIESSGNIGIGTNNPGELLHMFSSSNLTLKIHTTGPTSPSTIEFKGPSNGRIDFTPDTSGSASGRIMYVHSDDSMRFQTDSTEKVRITTNGRLLVGTATTNNAGSYSSVVSTGGSGNNGGFQAHYNAATFGGGSMTTINGGGGGLIFWTYTGNLGSESFTERMRVDSNGYITKPSTPAFLAYHQASDLNYAVGDTLYYPYTVYNIGNHYNTSNSTFTAPIAGRYLFSINAQAYYQSSVSGVPRAYWKINGNNVGNNIHLRGSDNQSTGSAADGLEQRSQTVIFNLSANDTVKVVVGENRWDIFGANSFTGYLIG